MIMAPLEASVRASDGRSGASVRSCQRSLLPFSRGRSAIVVQQSGRGKTPLFNAGLRCHGVLAHYVPTPIGLKGLSEAGPFSGGRTPASFSGGLEFGDECVSIRAGRART
jgi:hypothetical protein